MGRLLIFLVFLIASVWIGIEMFNHQGYLLLVYKPWFVQMPLWFALVSFIVFCILFYIFVYSIDHVHFVWFRFKNWLRFRREHKSYSKTQHGLALLVEGRFKKAEKVLTNSVNEAIEPLMNYLGAAKAAQEQQAYERRDHYVQKAYQTVPDAYVAIGLVQAELELQQDQLERAMATLNRLRQQHPRHPRVLQLQEKVLVRLGDFDQLLRLLPALRKAKVLTAEQAQQFEKNMYCDLLNRASTKNLDELHAFWNDLPRHVRKNPDVIAAYVNQLLRIPNATHEIEELIRYVLKNHWRPDLVNIYGTLPFTNLNRPLVIVGTWVKIHGQQPELLLALGRLCARIPLWGKARDYFERCLAQGPNSEASLEYGKLLEKLHEPEAALQKYREGLTQVDISSVAIFNS